MVCLVLWGETMWLLGVRGVGDDAVRGGVLAKRLPLGSSRAPL